MSVETDYQQPDSVEDVNGVLGCASCHGLLCLQDRSGRRNHAGPTQIAHALTTRPARDVERVLCAACGDVLFQRNS